MKNLDPSIDSRFWLTITRSVATFEKCASGDFTVLSTFLLKILQITLQIWTYIPKTCQEVKLKAECSFWTECCFVMAFLWPACEILWCERPGCISSFEMSLSGFIADRGQRLLPPVRDFHPVSYFHPREFSLWSLIFSSMSSPLDSMGRGLSSFEENWLLLHVRITAHTSLATAVHPKI